MSIFSTDLWCHATIFKVLLEQFYHANTLVKLQVSKQLTEEKMLQCHQFAILLLATSLRITGAINIIDDDNTPRKPLTPIVFSKLIPHNRKLAEFFNWIWQFGKYLEGYQIYNHQSKLNTCTPMMLSIQIVKFKFYQHEWEPFRQI